MSNRKIATTKPVKDDSLKCAIDHMFDAQAKGEINEDNVLYIVENINVAGMLRFFLSFFRDEHCWIGIML